MKDLLLNSLRYWKIRGILFFQVEKMQKLAVDLKNTACFIGGNQFFQFYKNTI